MVDLVLLVLPGLIWGASFLFIAEGLEAMAPDGVTFLRMVIGFLTLTLVPAARVPVRRGVAGRLESARRFSGPDRTARPSGAARRAMDLAGSAVDAGA